MLAAHPSCPSADFGGNSLHRRVARRGHDNGSVRFHADLQRLPFTAHDGERYSVLAILNPVPFHRQAGNLAGARFMILFSRSFNCASVRMRPFCSRSTSKYPCLRQGQKGLEIFFANGLELEGSEKCLSRDNLGIYDLISRNLDWSCSVLNLSQHGNLCGESQVVYRYRINYLAVGGILIAVDSADLVGPVPPDVHVGVVRHERVGKGCGCFEETVYGRLADDIGG